MQHNLFYQRSEVLHNNAKNFLLRIHTVLYTVSQYSCFFGGVFFLTFFFTRISWVVIAESLYVYMCIYCDHTLREVPSNFLPSCKQYRSWHSSGSWRCKINLILNVQDLSSDLRPASKVVCIDSFLLPFAKRNEY